MQKTNMRKNYMSMLSGKHKLVAKVEWKLM